MTTPKRDFQDDRGNSDEHMVGWPNDDVVRTIQLAVIFRCEQAAADWFTLPPTSRTKENLLTAISKVKDWP